MASQIKVTSAQSGHISYQRNPKQFDQAILDMLRLFCLGYFPQLFEKQKNLLEDLIYNKLFVEKTVVMGEGACVVNLAIGGVDYFTLKPLPNLVEKNELSQHCL
ncbi:hypothetical protein L11322_00174 [Chlamydia trachomatis L1/1322/p2]|nr:hypothetical protein L11322_00174 [Chlamydia trachomatis L1/1322/p2]CCP63985.1 hypothetical protein L1115_00173 [Chlamydia trachomatis L1/115]CCP64874.1 hypothetical protein L1224_00173 [Chlamydia trachomatis L1/224]CCP66654.1 hypothetical protein L3404_00173 [Chlamydia trachomatis L3/404/LN]CRH23889.1 Uncharacterised protein [Chlamydia trachomatis]